MTWALPSSLLAAALLATSTHAFSPSVTSRSHDVTKLFASGGMDAYAAQMAALTAGNNNNAPPVADTNVSEPVAVAAPQQSTPAATTASSVITGGASASSAITAMATSQSNILSQIANSIPDLAPKPDLSYDAASSSFAVRGRPVSLDARDAPGPANIAWLSSLCIEDTLSSLTIFNGPLTDVPHLISRCAVVENTDSMHFFLDFRPRAYGAYDLRDSDGTYPGPDALGRKAFEYSGARKDFDTKFGTDEVVQFMNGIVEQLEGGVTRMGEDMSSLNDLEKVTRGPLALDVIVPLR